jgi:hypothetical protein
MSSLSVARDLKRLIGLSLVEDFSLVPRIEMTDYFTSSP